MAAQPLLTPPFLSFVTKFLIRMAKFCAKLIIPFGYKGRVCRGCVLQKDVFYVQIVKLIQHFFIFPRGDLSVDLLKSVKVSKGGVLTH